MSVAIVLSIDTVVETEYGPIQGTLTPLIRQFTKVPYAAPPLGNLRFAAPEKHAQWPDILPTVDVPPGCPQNCTCNVPNVCPAKTSEDCLYLNIFTPLADDYSHTLYPVFVWIHGGGYRENYGMGIRMNATHLVNTTEVIVVSINYRLGVLGFFYDHSLDLRGNFGYLDQQFAIEWVYNNIGHFGGNPESITIGGESAGGGSVNLLLTNTSNPHIKGAIAESSPLGMALRTTDTWGDIPYDYEYLVGCGMNESNANTDAKRLQCMRFTVSADALIATQTNQHFSFQPTVGTGLFADQPIFLYQKGLFLNVPFIIGTNKHEMCSAKALSYTQLQSNLNHAIGASNTAQVLQFYNAYDICGGGDANNGGNTNCCNVSCLISTDYQMRCPSRNVTNAAANAYTDTNFYYYHLEHGSSFNDQLYLNPFCWDIPCHTAELWYVFYSPMAMKQQLNVSFAPSEITLANQMNAYWTNFFDISKDPNHKRKADQTIIDWIPYTTAHRELILLDVNENLKMAQNFDAQVCDFWDSLNYSWLPRT